MQLYLRFRHVPGFGHVGYHSLVSLHYEGRLLLGDQRREIRLASTYGPVVHFRNNAVRDEDSGKILSWKVRHLGKYWLLIRDDRVEKSVSRFSSKVINFFIFSSLSEPSFIIEAFRKWQFEDWLLPRVKNKRTINSSPFLPARLLLERRHWSERITVSYNDFCPESVSNDIETFLGTLLHGYFCVWLTDLTDHELS